MDNCVFAIDFTHHHITASFVAPDGAEEGTAGFDLIDFTHDTAPLDKLISLILAKVKASRAACSAIVLSMACDLDRDRTVVLRYPEAPWLDGQPFPGMLSAALSIPVIMERRAVVQLYYDMAMHGLPPDSLALACYIDSHYDSAIWHNGKPVLGRNGAAGSISHITIHDREDRCHCGKTGCVELYGAGIRLDQLCTMIFPDTPRNDLFTQFSQHPILLDYIAMMAYPIAVEANVLDPEYIIIGGDVPSMPGFPRDYLEEQIRSHRYAPYPDWQTVFLPSAASQVTGVVPAAQFARIREKESSR